MPLQPKRGPITGNPNQMERGGQISDGPRRTANLRPWQATILMAFIILLTLVSSFPLLFWETGTLATFPEYEEGAVEDTADRDY